MATPPTVGQTASAENKEEDEETEGFSGALIETMADEPTDDVLLEDLPFSVPYEIGGIQTGSDGRPFLEVKVNGIEALALLDSGAAVTVMADKFWKRLANVELQPSEARLCAANGGLLTVLGQAMLEIEVDGLTDTLKMVVIAEGGHDVILGYDYWRAAGWKIARPGVTPLDAVGLGIENEIAVNQDLTPPQRHRVLEVVKEFIVGEPEVLTQTPLLEHSIELEPGSRPFMLRSHHFSPALESKMRAELERMLRMGVIEPSSSPVASPIVPQIKKDGATRLCLDSRLLNSMTVKDRYPTPNLPAMIGRLQSAKWYISVDLKSAFWQVGLNPEKKPGQFASSRELTAFIFPGRGLFHFKVMPFGLCNSPATQCRLMHLVLGHDLEPYVVVYLDDILIMGTDFEETLTRLKEVTRRLKEANLAVNLDKCQFFCRQVVFLGYLIGGGEIKPDPGKVAAITSFPVPRSTKEVRRFLGLAGYYRRLIPDFSGMTAALSDLLKNEQRFKWSPEADNAFAKLKLALSSDPVVRNPQFELEFILQCDASDVAAAAALGQIHDGIEVAIAFFSHKWQKFEKNWAATEKEAACVLYAIRHFRSFVAGAHFTVITDAKALLHLKKVRTDGSSKLARWSLELNEYNITIEHRKGEENVVADALSRAVDVITTDEEDLDPWLEEMVRKMALDPQRYPDYRWEARRLYRFESVSDDVGGYSFAWREYVPSRVREAIIDESHRALNHVGWKKSYEVLRRQWFWPGQLPDVKARIQGCQVCQHCKRRPQNTRVPMGASRIANLPFQVICIDHWGPVPRSATGNTYLLVVVDVLTKYVLLHPCRNARAKAVTEFLENGVFAVFGVPEKLISDNAKAFMGRDMMILLNDFGVEQWSIPFHHPQANMAERYIQTVATAVRSMVFEEGGDHRMWDRRMPQIQGALNAVRSESTGQSPYKLLFGKDMIMNARDYQHLTDQGTPRDELTDEELVSQFDELRTRAKRALEESQTQFREQYDRNTHVLKFSTGERVWRKNRALSNAAEGFSHKLAPKFVPATITQVLGEDTYILRDVSGGRPAKYHANDLFKDRPQEPLTPEAANCQ